MAFRALNLLLSLLIATQPVQASVTHPVANAASLLHGVVGCASAEAAGGNCASGFITAFGTEIASGYMGKGFEPDPNASAVEQEQARQAYAQQRAKMVGAALGYLTSGGNATNVSPCIDPNIRRWFNCAG